MSIKNFNRRCLTKQWLRLQKCFAWIFPYTCILCQHRSNRIIDLCSNCEQALPWLKHACVRCSASLPKGTLCGICMKNPPAFENTLALFHYEFPINYLITQFKFHKRLIYAKILGELLTTQLAIYYQQKPKPQMIIPIPLHYQRLRERGFNQALELSRIISRKLNIPINLKVCQRIKATEPQSSLPMKKRKNNVKNAFQINPKLCADHVLVIDDVITTGHTIQAFCNTLKQHGVARIDVSCVARTSRK